MKEHLLQESFAKAKRESGKESKHGCCVYLAEEISENHNYPVSYKTFEHLYDAMVLETRETPNLKTALLDALAIYLGAENYADYVNGNSTTKIQNGRGINQKRLNYTAYTLIGLIALIMIGYPIYQKMTGPKCMVWINDHYEHAECNGKNTVAFDKETFKNLEQVNVDRNTDFFDDQGNPLIWYVKNSGKISYFSFYGIDPETGKTLKPITDYMIEKYVK